jgi:tetratricopeptide (TPR) repeat protein
MLRIWGGGGAIMGMVPDRVDFFVSYTSADRPWAEWIAWELEQAGHSTIIQAWDMQPGSNFVLEMDNATRAAERTIAVLSPAFLESSFCRAEWAAAFRSDPTGCDRGLVPVRVRECEPDGLLGQIVYLDVVGLSQAASRDKLLSGVAAGRVKPAGAPAFPPAESRSEVGERVRRPEEGAAIFNVPVMTRTFVGRTGPLQRLGEGLAGEGVVAVTQVHAIHGMGGVGKTQLAARYARTHRDAYDVIWWLRAEQPAALRADFARLAVALGLTGAGDVDEQDAIDSAREWLERNRRWLLVFDNVVGPEDIAELVPEGDGGHVVITSRAHADWRSLGAQPLGLDVWEREEAVEFLFVRSGERDRVVADAVAQALGDLPLALEQAAAYSSRQVIGLVGYLQRLQDRAPELFSAGRPQGYEHTVATVWAMAFEQVADNSVASDLLGVCACLAPERIPRELLDGWAENADAPGVTAAMVGEAIELLLGYALLTATADQTLGLHRLIGQLARDNASHAERERAAASAVTLLDRLLADRPWEHEQWPVCQRLLAHALSATQHADALNAVPEQTAHVLVRVGQHQRTRAQFTSARQLLTRALAINEAVHGPEDPEVAITLRNLGRVQWQLGELEEARASQRRALAIQEAVYGLEHPEVAITLGDLGRVQWQLGEFEQARATQRRALAIKEAVYGLEHPEVAATLGNLGIVQQQLGEFEQARATQRRALAIKEAVYGAEHPEVARTLANLGLVQEQLGELEEARTHMQHAVRIFEGFLGTDHNDTAQARALLAGIGNPADAQPRRSRRPWRLR